MREVGGGRLWSGFSVSLRGVSVQKLVPSFYWTSQPDGICRRKCKCVDDREEREHGCPVVVSGSITGSDPQREGGGRRRSTRDPGAPFVGPSCYWLGTLVGTFGLI